jgi:hypothetical protein
LTGSKAPGPPLPPEKARQRQKAGGNEAMKRSKKNRKPLPLKILLSARMRQFLRVKGKRKSPDQNLPHQITLLI